MTLILNIAAILAGLGLVLACRPGRDGVSPRFLQSNLAQMLTPVLCLGLVTVGAANLIALALAAG